MAALGAEGRIETRVYLVGGATAVLTGWRDTTVDVFNGAYSRLQALALG